MRSLLLRLLTMGQSQHVLIRPCNRPPSCLGSGTVTVCGPKSPRLLHDRELLEQPGRAKDPGDAELTQGKSPNLALLMAPWSNMEQLGRGGFVHGEAARIIELVAFQVSLVSLLRQRGVLTREDTEGAIKAAREILFAVGFEQTQVTDAKEEDIVSAAQASTPSSMNH